MIEPIAIDCPYCGERFETQADTSAGSQSYVEDCAVCCRPIRFNAVWSDDLNEYELEARAEDD